MPAPPHSLHTDRCLPCWQIPVPPQSLHHERRLPCSQMLAPPHSLHRERCFPCSQTLAPPHSLQLERRLPCSQMLAPPHSLHSAFRLPCGHFIGRGAMVLRGSSPASKWSCVVAEGKKRGFCNFYTSGVEGITRDQTHTNVNCISYRVSVMPTYKVTYTYNNVSGPARGHVFPKPMLST